MSATPSGDWVQEIEALRKEVKELASQRCGMLSSNDFRKLHVAPEHEADFLEAFKKGDWDREIDHVPARQMFLIKPFDLLNLTPFSYDLSIGRQACSLRQDQKNSFYLTEKPHFIQPGETVVVLTEEYLALPPHYSATVWPRFGPVREGIFQSMVKIDPTWRGHLAVAMTNVSPARYPIKRGQLFGTLILYTLKTDTIFTLCHPSDVDPCSVVLGKILSFAKVMENLPWWRRQLRGQDEGAQFVL